MTHAMQVALVGIYALSLLIIIFVIGEIQEGAPVLNAIRAIFGYKPVATSDSLLRYPPGDNDASTECPRHGNKAWIVCWHCAPDALECGYCGGEHGWNACLTCHPEQRQGPQPFDVG